MVIIHNRKENCKTCMDELVDGTEEPCLTCMTDKENPDINYYTMYRRDYNKWPESNIDVARPVPRLRKEHDDESS